jgi:FixJ family two-component response regulator
VFVVDDGPAARRALARWLRSAVYQNQTFDSVEDFLERSHFDTLGCILLNLLNVRKPELNGLELQQALAAANQQLPIVFVAGHGDIP